MQFNLSQYAAIANSIDPEFHGEFDPDFGSNINEPIEQGISDFASAAGKMDYRTNVVTECSRFRGINPADFAKFEATEEDDERKYRNFEAPVKSHDTDEIPEDKSFDDFLSEIGTHSRPRATGVSGEEGDADEFEKMLADIGNTDRKRYADSLKQ